MNNIKSNQKTRLTMSVTFEQLANISFDSNVGNTIVGGKLPAHLRDIFLNRQFIRFVAGDVFYRKLESKLTPDDVRNTSGMTKVTNHPFVIKCIKLLQEYYMAKFDESVPDFHLILEEKWIQLPIIGNHKIWFTLASIVDRGLVGKLDIGKFREPAECLTHLNEISDVKRKR